MRRLLAVLLVVLSPAAMAQSGAIAEAIRALVTYGPIKQSSYKVIASQFATSSKAQISAELALAQGGLAAKAQLATVSKMMANFNDYGVYSGQGAQTCMSVNQATDIDGAATRRRDALAPFMGRNSDGRAPLAADEYELKRQSRLLGKYCSAQEHNLGICTSNFDGMESFGTDYAKLSRIDHLTDKQADAAKDFIASAVPAPPPPVPGLNCNGACQRARAGVLSSSALSSMAAFSLSSQMSQRTGAQTYLTSDN